MGTYLPQYVVLAPTMQQAKDFAKDFFKEQKGHDRVTHQAYSRIESMMGMHGRLILILQPSFWNADEYRSEFQCLEQGNQIYYIENVRDFERAKANQHIAIQQEIGLFIEFLQVIDCWSENTSLTNRVRILAKKLESIVLGPAVRSSDRTTSPSATGCDGSDAQASHLRRSPSAGPSSPSASSGPSSPSLADPRPNALYPTPEKQDSCELEESYERNEGRTEREITFSLSEEEYQRLIRYLCPGAFKEGS